MNAVKLKARRQFLGTGQPSLGGIALASLLKNQAAADI